MPYRKRYPKKRKYVRKSNGSDGSRALVIAKKLNRLISFEHKFLDTQQNAVAASVTGVISQISNMSQGDTTSTRNGSNVKVISIYLSYFISQHASSTSTQMRIMLVQDNQTNQAIYATNQLLQDPTAGDNIVSARLLDNSRRFTVFYDKSHSLSATGETTINRRFYKKCNILLRYDANAGTVADLTEKSLSMITFTNEAANFPLITSFVRVMFVDN